MPFNKPVVLNSLNAVAFRFIFNACFEERVFSTIKLSCIKKNQNFDFLDVICPFLVVIYLLCSIQGLAREREKATQSSITVITR